MIIISATLFNHWEQGFRTIWRSSNDNNYISNIIITIVIIMKPLPSIPSVVKEEKIFDANVIIIIILIIINNVTMIEDFYRCESGWFSPS